MTAGRNSRAASAGRLVARPSTVNPDSVPTGLKRLGLGNGRDGFVFAPAWYRPETPLPLVVVLHGAGGSAQQGVGLVEALADQLGVIIVAPDSRGRTWDVLLGGFGPDISFIDQALEQVLSRYVVAEDRIAIGGFSDGASYALSVGLTNGDLFTHILAFSPGFVAAGERQGAPEIYVSHGTEDSILPINACSRRIVPMLTDLGYDVRYHEFNGPHTVPPAVALEALRWFVGDIRVA